MKRVHNISVVKEKSVKKLFDWKREEEGANESPDQVTQTTIQKGKLKAFFHSPITNIYKLLLNTLGLTEVFLSIVVKHSRVLKTQVLKWQSFLERD
jgi:hypothetical protein